MEDRGAYSLYSNQLLLPIIAAEELPESKNPESKIRYNDHIIVTQHKILNISCPGLKIEHRPKLYVSNFEGMEDRGACSLCSNYPIAATHNLCRRRLIYSVILDKREQPLSTFDLCFKKRNM